MNAGICGLEPGALDYIPAGSFYDMPDLFEDILEDNRPATVFLIREYWQDIGWEEQFEQLERANGEYEEVFDA